MNEHTPDDDIQALRAADPAAGVEAPTSLRARIATLSDGSASESGPVELRRPRRWLLPVAAAGAVIAAIGGGYVWGTGGVDLTPPAAPMAVATGTPDDPGAPIGLGGGAPGAAGEGGVSGASVATGAEFSMSTTWGPGWGISSSRQRFSVPDFDTAPGEAEVFALDGAAHYSEQEAARVAAELGIPGDVQDFTAAGQPGWIVGDMSGPYLLLMPTGGADLSFRTAVTDPTAACHVAVSPGYPPISSAAPRVVDSFYVEVNQCLADTPLPTDAQARDALRSYLSVVGLDEADVQITVTLFDEQRVAYVTATRLVGSDATEVTISVTVSAEGLLFGGGPTADIVSLGTYDIVSPAEAAARLNDPAFSPRLVSQPDYEGDDSEYTAPTAPPAVPEAGSPVPWPIAEREIVSARRGLALVYGADDVRYLVPAYEFTADDDTVWSVTALAEDDLDTTSTGWSGGWWW